MPKSYGYWPIIYVRGYAMSRTEIDETTADPFCGFNLGSTVIRATPDPKTPPASSSSSRRSCGCNRISSTAMCIEDGVDIGDPDLTADIRQAPSSSTATTTLLPRYSARARPRRSRSSPRA